MFINLLLCVHLLCQAGGWVLQIKGDYVADPTLQEAHSLGGEIDVRNKYGKCHKNVYTQYSDSLTFNLGGKTSHFLITIPLAKMLDQLIESL